MKRQSSILAGTALGLLMASAPLGASPLQGMAPSRATTPLVLAQAACAEGQSAEECAQGEPGKKKHRQEQQGEASSNRAAAEKANSSSRARSATSSRAMAAASSHRVVASNSSHRAGRIATSSNSR